MTEAKLFEKVLVTGGTGFIGRHLLGALGLYGLRPLAPARSLEKVEGLPQELRDGARWIELNLLDGEATRSLIEDERPEFIFHLAGTRGRDKGADGAAAACQELNVRATVNLLEAATSAKVRRVVLVGSAEEYGRQAGALTETLAVAPATPYGVSKALATKQALAAHAASGCPVVVLRPFTVYGPHQPPEMFVAQAVKSALDGSEFKMTEGTQKRDLIHVTDVVRALVVAGSADGVDGKVINVGSGRPLRLCDLARLIWQLSDSSAPLRIGARAAPPEELFDTWADITLAREALGWEPRVGLEEGLREMLAWERARQETLAS